MFRTDNPPARQVRAVLVRAVHTACLLLMLTSLAVPAVADGPHPLEVAAHFLSLSEEQVAGIIAIEQALHEASAPVVQQVVEGRRLLKELIASGEPDPTEVGTAVLSIRALEQQVAALRRDASGQIRELLDGDQLERLQAASEARPLCHVLPALGALHLL